MIYDSKTGLGLVKSVENSMIEMCLPQTTLRTLPFFGGESPYIVDATPTSGTSEASDQNGCGPLG
jgi:hypothetical protein